MCFRPKNDAFIDADSCRSNLFLPRNQKKDRIAECSAFYCKTAKKAAKHRHQEKFCVLQARGENQPYVVSKGQKLAATVIPGNAVKSHIIILEPTCNEFVSRSLPSDLFVINRCCSRNHSDGIYCAHSINSRSKCLCSQVQKILEDTQRSL